MTSSNIKNVNPLITDNPRAIELFFAIAEGVKAQHELLRLIAGAKDQSVVRTDEWHSGEPRALCEDNVVQAVRDLWRALNDRGSESTSERQKESNQ